MIEVESQSPQPSPPPILNYHAENAVAARLIVGQAITSAVFTCIATSIVASVLIYLGTEGLRFSILAVLLGLLYLGLANLLAWNIKSKPYARGWAIGIWIGLFVSCLLLGGCAIMGA